MEQKNIVIGIEGLVGSGKTSICRELLKRDESFVLLHGGNLYRAIVYAVMKKEPNLFKLRKLLKSANIKQYMDDLKVELKIEDRESKIYIDGKLADSLIENKAAVKELIQSMAQNKSAMDTQNQLIAEQIAADVENFNPNDEEDKEALKRAGEGYGIYQKEAYDKYGISRGDISSCINGKLKHAGKHPVTGEPLTWQKLEK